MSSEERQDTVWRDVKRLIGDLEADGYTVISIQSSTSEAVGEKSITLVVER